MGSFLIGRMFLVHYKMVVSVLSIRVMQARNVYRQRFPSVESIESWNDHGDSIELEADSLVQVNVIFQVIYEE